MTIFRFVSISLHGIERIIACYSAEGILAKMTLTRSMSQILTQMILCKHSKACWRTYTIPCIPTQKAFLSSKTQTNEQKRKKNKTYNVWLSTCQDIHTNLALEEWIFKNTDFSSQSLLLLWRNKPCVVIGRHQNPWAECDVTGCVRQGITVARRCSGGGTVYHDLGNMCVTFFTSRSEYNRKRNLELVTQILQEKWNVDVKVTDRDDILLQNIYKVFDPYFH